MPTREQVLSMVERGMSYEQVAEQYGVSPGFAYLVATGMPADGSDAFTAAEEHRRGTLRGSTQRLSNPPHEDPTTKDSVHRWIKERAAADVQMQQAASRRTAEPGEIRDPEGNHDVLAVLTRQHDQVTALVKQIETIPAHKKGASSAQVEQRASIIDLIAVALSRHESAEEQHLWPLVRRCLPDGDERADEALAQEQEGKETLAALGKTEPASDKFDNLVEKLITQLNRHVAFEDRIFLALLSAVSESDREDVGERVLERQGGARDDADDDDTNATAVENQSASEHGDATSEGNES